MGTRLRSRRSLVGFAAILVAVGASPAVAQAHSLSLDNDPNRPLWKYVWLGFQHMALGWDHLLFICGVVLIARNLKTAAKLISLFVAGHSLTLLVATLAKWQIDPTVVDVVIALSVVYVGVRGIRGGPVNMRIDGAIIFGFGLIHGLGLSTRLQDLGLPDDGLIWRVLLFNVGVEIGQLTAITIIVGLGTLIARQLKERDRAQVVASGVLIAAGFVAAAVLAFSGGAEDDGKGLSASCSELAAKLPATGAGGHPPKRFYGPNERVPGTDFAHVLGDGFVVVIYPKATPPARTAELRDWVLADDKAVVAGAGDAGGDAVRAYVANRELRCSKLDIASLTTFRDDWFDEIRE